MDKKIDQKFYDDLCQEISKLSSETVMWDYKDYVFGTLLYRYLSDKLEESVKKLKGENFDYSLITDLEAEALKDQIINEVGYFLYPSQLFSNVARKANRYKNLGETLDTIFEQIENSPENPRIKENLKNIFDGFSTDNWDLGLSEERRNFKLTQLLDFIKNLEFNENSGVSYNALSESFIDHLASSSGTLSKDFYTPVALTELMALIAISGKGKVNTIYDPASGVGIQLIKAAKILNSNEDKPILYGQERMPNVSYFSKMNLIINGIDLKNFDIRFGNTLINPLHKDLAPFDVIISSPPFGLRWENNDISQLVQEERFTRAGVTAPKFKTDFAFILHIISYLSPEGTAVSSCLPGLLSHGGSEEKIRRYLVNNNFVDAVIQLPAKIMYGTGIAPCLLVLKKNKNNEDILFINASNEFEKTRHKNKLSPANVEQIYQWYLERKDIELISKVVSNEDVADKHYNLLPAEYLLTDLNEILNKTEPLEDLTEFINVGSFRNPKFRSKSKKLKETSKVLVIDKTNLQNEIINNVKNLSAQESPKSKFYIADGDIVISRNFSGFKAAIYNITKTSEPVVADSNLFVIRTNKKLLDPYYLLSYLNSNIFKKEIELRNPGNYRIMSVNTNSLKSVQVPIVSMEKQHQIGNDFKNLVDKKLDLEEQMKKISKDEDEFFQKSMDSKELLAD